MCKCELKYELSHLPLQMSFLKIVFEGFYNMVCIMLHKVQHLIKTIVIILSIQIASAFHCSQLQEMCTHESHMLCNVKQIYMCVLVFCYYPLRFMNCSQWTFLPLVSIYLPHCVGTVWLIPAPLFCSSSIPQSWPSQEENTPLWQPTPTQLAYILQPPVTAHLLTGL